jgi:signal transduction histidine kinase
VASKKRPAKNTSSIPVSGVRGRSIPVERVSQTTISRVHADEAVTGEQIAQLADVPAAWLEALLVASVELPVDAGADAVVRAVVDAVASSLTSHAVGACFATSEGQRVYRRVPQGAAPRDAGFDPARLFPSFARERVLDAGGPSVTLHVACDGTSAASPQRGLHQDDPFKDDEHAREVVFARRAASVLARGLLLARAHEAAQAARRELAALESRAIQADKLASFGQIAASLVHELNNPLTSIVAYSDYLIRRVAMRPDATPSEDVDRLKRIGDSANRMLRFTRDLVSYARPSSEIAVTLVLHDVIDQAIAFCEHVIGGADATVERRYSEHVRTLRGMPEQLTQVFVNLITNACQALPSGGGRIVFETRVDADGKRAVVAIKDNGHGIAPAEVPHVFTPFFTTKRDGGGTGLGLSIVKSIVDRHGGTIRVESSKPGGTTFTIELPLGASSGGR